MEDPKLNRRIEEVRELQTRWSQFHDFVNLAQSGQPITPEAEVKFLELKTRIAQLHGAYVTALKYDHEKAAAILDIITKCIFLRRLTKIGKADQQKLEREWHDGYILMNETIDALEEQREQLANVNEKAYKARMARERMTKQFHAYSASRKFQVLFGSFVLIFVTYLVPVLGIYDYTNLVVDLPWTAKVYFPVMNFYRENINSNLRFARLEHVPSTDVGTAQHTPDGTEARTYNPTFFGAHMVDIGFKEEDTGVVEGMLKDRIAFDGEARTMKSNGRRLVGFKILFNTSAEAERFVRLRRESLNSWDAFIRKQVDDLVYVCRKANFVIIFCSEESALRVDYPKARYGFTEEQSGL